MMMGSTPERCKKSKTCKDRISNLPNNLIGLILSLLTLKEAVATSVLSTRWKSLWTLLTKLEFNDKVKPKPPNGNDALKLRMSFTTFVYRVLQQSKSLPISKFSFQCSKSYDVSHVIAWISTALRSNVEVLDICIPMEEPALLPWNLFISETLVELRLGKVFYVNLQGSVFLPRLKVLCLNKVKLSDEDSISRLIGGCPLIEELIMAQCIGEKVKVVNISSPSLTALHLTTLGYDRSSHVSRINIVLETPKLSYLLIKDVVACGYELKDLQYLNAASIDIRFGYEDKRELYRRSLQGLLEAVSEVKFLKLGFDTMEALTRYECEVPIFQKVIEFECASADREYTWELFPLLLDNMLCLKTLVFPYGLGYDEDDDKYWDWVEPDVPRCFLTCLKKIEIREYEGWGNENRTVRYFLENAKVLEKLIIRLKLLHMESKACASRNCKVEIL